ncbi:MAG: acetate--CoA ligase family protein [Oscillospiraceae bacterium]|nr:acetate--CoA ligase family protein [Oscillospiraceae bacterium]
MNLYEYEGKAILAKHGIRVPWAVYIADETEVSKLDDMIYPCVIKAQILQGGRGKAGGIRPVNNVAEARAAAYDLLSKELKGERLAGVLAEEQVDISKELYLGITVDDVAGKPLLILSADGGVEIETVAEESPEKLVRRYLAPDETLDSNALAQLCREAGIDPVGAVEIIRALEKAFREEDANLMEINPLCVLADGGVCACDAKVILDDYALFRHPDAPKHEMLEYDEDPFERRAKDNGYLMVRLGGDIAVISVGAGYGMAIVDAIQAYGGAPANFVDQLGGTPFERTVNGVLDMAEEDLTINVVLMSFMLSASSLGGLVESTLTRLKSRPSRVPIFGSIGAASAAVRDMDLQTAVEKLEVAGIKMFQDAREAIQAAIKCAGEVAE